MMRTQGPRRLRSLAVVGLTLSLGVAACNSAVAQPKPPPANPTPASSFVFGQTAAPLPKPATLEGAPDIATLVSTIESAVVNITTTANHSQSRGVDPFEFFFGPGRRPFGMPDMPSEMPEQRAMGSGFIVDPDGYVVTNNHVIENADQVTVRLTDRRVFRATVVGRDPKLDIALIKLEGAKDLPSVVLGDSDKLRVGEYVVAVGNPFGLGHTVTMGIVSAKDRTIGAGPYDDFIQTDASINPGNSGGPLFDLRGTVVGINTAIHAQGQGIGFAIPVNMVRGALHQLRETGHVTRGKLGLVFQPVTDDLARALKLDRPIGALVSEIEPNGPADKAGLRPGDLILGVNGTQVLDGNQLPRLIARNAPGETVTLDIVRAGKSQTVRATLGALEGESKGIGREQREENNQTPNTEFGLRLGPSPEGQGVLVLGVRGQASGKLLPRDIILQVDGRPVSQPQEVTRALQKAAQEKRPALVQVRRQNRTVFVALEVSR